MKPRVEPAERTTGPVARVSSRSHALIDYCVAVVLILGPWLIGFTERDAPGISRALGCCIIGYTAISKLPMALVHVIPVPVHLFLDLIVAVMLVGAPIHFAMGGSAGGFFVFLGVVLGLNALVARKRRF